MASPESELSNLTSSPLFSSRTDKVEYLTSSPPFSFTHNGDFLNVIPLVIPLPPVEQQPHGAPNFAGLRPSQEKPKYEKKPKVSRKAFLNNKKR